MNLDNSRILVVKPSSLGDVVHTLPVVHALKRLHPSCYIGWIVQAGFSAILEPDPAVDEIIPIAIPSTSDPHAARGAVLRATTATVSTWRKLRKRFRSRPYNVVLDLHASFRSGLLEIANPGGIRIGFADAKELNTLFQHYTIAPDPQKPHAVDKNLLFAEYLGCQPQPEDFRIATSPRARDNVRKLLESEQAPAERIVYANPAARWTTKMWTVQAWAELADLLIHRSHATVVLAGSSADVPYIRSITHRMKARPVVAAGKIDLADAVALMEICAAYVGVDSGPMHIAAFSRIPVVALFGPTDPAKVGPYGNGHRVVRSEGLTCLACRKRSCDARRCMEEIVPERVYEETRELLNW
ncbi:MAG: glycosyltransferase family 9 protein [Thermodesulfobacteriota bacterium]